MAKRQIINSREDVEKKAPSYTVAGNVTWHSHYGKQFLKKLKILYDPAISLLSIDPEKTLIQTQTHPNAHCNTAYSRQEMEATCPLTDEW